MGKPPPTDEERLQELVREAHDLIVTLKTLIKEAKPLVDRLVEDAVTESIGEQVRVGLDAYQSEIMEAIDKAQQAVFRRFDDLANTLLTGKARGT